MRILLAATLATAFLAGPTMALADDATATGAAGGAIAGAVVGGPVGAVVGGVAGAAIGSATDDKPDVVVTKPACQTNTTTQKSGGASTTTKTSNC